jgi:hypothetical protein
VVTIASAKYYSLFFTSLGNKEIDLNSDTFKVMLTTSTYTPNQDTHQYKSSVTNEVSGAGYTATGVSVGSLTMSYNTGTNVWSFDGIDASWTGISVTARYAVLYDSTPGTDATRPLVGYVDFGSDVVVSGTDLAVVWDAAGIATVTVA